MNIRPASDPVLGTNPIVDAMEQRRGYIESLRQNTSRLAQSYNSCVTYGNGRLRLADEIEFHCTFIEQPVVAYGASVTSELAENDYPMCTGGVFKWRVDSRGFYVGCYVFVTVDCDEDYPTVVHDFTFTGIGMKDLPDHLLDL